MVSALEARLLRLRKAMAATETEDERAELIKEGGALAAEVDFLRGCGVRCYTTRVA